MIVTYAVELLRDVKPELEAILPLHWKEIAGDKERVKLDPDWDGYFAFEEAGVLHLMVARCEGRLIGYHLSLVKGHLHYKSTLHALTDLYFILPDFRKGRVGIQMFKEVEKSWKARGVVKDFTGTKTYADKSRIFQHLGWRHVENLYCKVLG